MDFRTTNGFTLDSTCFFDCWATLLASCVAVSIVSGAAYKHLKIRHALRMAVFFGGFQAIMPTVGSLAGMTIRAHIENCDHWAAFGILTAIGAKMIYESFKIKTAAEVIDPSNILVLFALSIATSIDALAIGITLSFLRVLLVTAVAIIGLVTFTLSYLGTVIGNHFGHSFENKSKLRHYYCCRSSHAKIMAYR